MNPARRQGRGRAAIVDPSTPPSEWRFDGPFSHNLQLYESATILAQLIRRDPLGKAWHLGIGYVEFENNGGAVVSPPTPAAGEGQSYYAGLSLSPTRDYLRVPVVYTQLESNDEERYPNGNLVTFHVHTAGTVGVHGKPFSSAQQSRVYGMALVASPEPEDSSQDLIYARVYYSVANRQLIKAATTQIGLQYQLPFEL